MEQLIDAVIAVSSKDAFAEQVVIAITGAVAIWLANDEREALRKWACIFGLAGQPFWLHSSWLAEQWGILALTIVFTVAWGRGFHNHWLRPRRQQDDIL